MYTPPCMAHTTSQQSLNRITILSDVMNDTREKRTQFNCMKCQRAKQQLAAERENSVLNSYICEAQNYVRSGHFVCYFPFSDFLNFIKEEWEWRHLIPSVGKHTRTLTRNNQVLFLWWIFWMFHRRLFMHGNVFAHIRIKKKKKLQAHDGLSELKELVAFRADIFMRNGMCKAFWLKFID